MTPRRLSDYLRHGEDAELRRRRGVVALSLGAAGVMGLIATYQVGLVRRLPEPRVGWLDSAKVNASPQAYGHAHVPDGLLGLTSYAVTATLAAAGGADRARRHPWLSLATAAKVLADAANAIKLTWDERAKQHVYCGYCLLATVATLGTVPLVYPEARRAVSSLLAGR